MIRVLLGVFFITLGGGVFGQQGFVFEGEARRQRPISDDDSGDFGVPARPSGVRPSTIDSIFQIPIAVIQGTSAAAQSFYPNNGEMIDKVFNIPVQTLHAVGNLIKDRYPPLSERYDQNTREDPKREELMKTRELEIQRRKQQLEEKERVRELQRLKRQQPQQDDQVEGRRHHSIYDPFAWADALVDLVGGHGGHFGGPGGLHGGHNHGNPFGGHQKKKRKKKKPHGGHFHQQGGHNHGHGGHFGGHGSHGGPQFHGGNNRPYEVTENLEDVAPQGGLFSWFQPTRRSPQIQNKIAPRY
ncbi:uncharacterized protein LOC135167733 [Diachasmimorpha longicaudata]|uniref:uncharacterized protein LOC135167733 n=1 Tax=Diachasmimorpha longicaudata TaxID=58733 RepID=UPI0030B90CB0